MILWYRYNAVAEASLVADINPGPADCLTNLYGIAPRNHYARRFAGALYFQANDGQNGAELWRTTGTGASMVADISPGPDGSSPHSFAIYQNALYFAATTPATGEELFRYDGTAVSLAADIDPGPAGGIIGGLTVFDGALYFTRKSPSETVRVWRFDGASALPVAGINQAIVQAGGFSIESGVRTFTVFDGRLYYILVTPLPHHYGLWAYDGSTAQKIANLSPEDDIAEYGFDLGVFNSTLYFGVVAGSSFNGQDELWSYDGQSSPKKIAALGSAYTWSQPQQFVVLSKWLYFSSGGALYRHDGVVLENVSEALPSMPSAPSELTLCTANGANQLYLTGFFNDWLSREPYFFDGVETNLIKNIMPDDQEQPGSFPTVGVQVADRLYFFAEDAEHGRELWSVRPEAKIEIYAVLVPIWEDKLKWPIAEGVSEIVFATYLISERELPRLVMRRAVRLPAKPERLEFLVLEIDRSRQIIPDAFGLLLIVFDGKTGERIGFDVKMFGVAAKDTRTELERAAVAYCEETEAERVMSAPVQSLDELRPLQLQETENS